MLRGAVKLLVTAALLAGMAGPARADIVGVPTVVDGDTVIVAGQRLRLNGIDAPEMRQTCQRYGEDYPCGKLAATTLNDIVGITPLRCALTGKRDQGLPLATCFSGTLEVSGSMVYTGWALAVPRRGTRYARIEREARGDRRGLWEGRFEPPWRWRKRNGAAN